MLKVSYCSDLHLDNYRSFGRFSSYPELANESNSDVLIIAGDMSEYRLMAHHISFIEHLCSQYEKVLFVEGNHEFYHYDIQSTIDIEFPDNFTILRNESCVVGDVIFYGGTLWNDCTSLPVPDQIAITNSISDFSLITNNGNKITISDMASIHGKFMEDLYHLEYSDVDKSLVVISHFAPSLQSVAPMFAGNNLNPYFCNNLDSFIETSRIKHWVFGHVHHRHEYSIGNAMLHCNPRGYPLENDFTPRYTVQTFTVI